MLDNIICVSMYYTEMHESDYHNVSEVVGKGQQERRNQEFGSILFLHLYGRCGHSLHPRIPISRYKV